MDAANLLKYYELFIFNWSSPHLTPTIQSLSWLYNDAATHEYKKD